MRVDEAIRGEAVAWAVRSGDPGFAEWDALAEWLEADPAHAPAYAAVTAAVADAAELARPAAPVAANDEGEPQLPARGTRRWFAGALAACVAGLLALGMWQVGGDDRYTRQAAPGQVLAIDLGDGSRIDLAGGSTIELDHGNARFARLETGRALFTIRHDEADPFQLDAGGHRLVDAGTVFDVRSDVAGFAVAVAEGAVIFNPRDQNVRLHPGEALTIAAGAGTYTVGPVDAGQVGTWREGRLVFDNAPLAEVAADLARATGHPFRAAPGAPRGSVTGSILVDPVRRDPAAAGALLGLAVQRQGDGWIIGGR